MNNSPTRIRHILLDLDDTLIPTGIYYHQIKEAVIQRIRDIRPVMPRDRIMTIIDRIDTEAALHPNAFADDTRFARSLKATALQFGLTNDEAQWCYDQGMTVFNHEAVLFPTVIPTLQNLREQGLTIHLVTKGHVERQEDKITQTHLHRYIDGATVVSDKHPDRYRDLLFKRGYHPTQTIMVGDSLRDDVLSPNIAGIDAIHVRSNKPAWGYDTMSFTPSHSITAIDELPDMFHHWQRQPLTD